MTTDSPAEHLPVKEPLRRAARRKAFELLFEIEQHPGVSAAVLLERTFTDPETLEAFTNDEDGEGYVVLEARPGPPGGPELVPGQRASAMRQFVTELLQAVDAHRAEIDQELSKYPQDWSFERIGAAERVLLQLAVAEMVYLGTAYKVVIDESLELAKLYAQEEAARFINGILGAVVRNLDELKARVAAGGPA